MKFLWSNIKVKDLSILDYKSLCKLYVSYVPLWNDDGCLAEEWTLWPWVMQQASNTKDTLFIIPNI